MNDMTGIDEVRSTLARLDREVDALAGAGGAHAETLHGLSHQIGALVEQARRSVDGESEAFTPPLKIDHFGIAVRDLGQATRLFVGFLGARLVAGGINHAAKLRTTFIQFPDGGKIELLQPTGENPIYHFLEKRGEGIHHVTILVRDVVATTAALKEAGFRVVDEDFSAPGWKEAYISPRSALGCVLQIVQVGPDYGKPVEGITIDDVLADRWEWIDQRPVKVAG